MINIVMIHSVFWTGQSYAPAWTRDLALLVDVPLFFFLSGWAVILQPVGWKRTIHGTLAIYVNYAMIVALVWAALAVVAHRWVPWTEARNWFVFTNLNSYEYPCVLGSAWFLSAFIIIRLLTPVLARLATGSNRDFSLMLLASVAFLWMSGFAGSEKPGVFGLSLRQMAFFGLFYFLGLSFAPDAFRTRMLHHPDHPSDISLCHLSRGRPGVRDTTPQVSARCDLPRDFLDVCNGCAMAERFRAPTGLVWTTSSSRPNLGLER
jgi:surface polysaccharide O-acyltransferase-like enzyme